MLFVGTQTCLPYQFDCCDTVNHVNSCFNPCYVDGSWKFYYIKLRCVHGQCYEGLPPGGATEYSQLCVLMWGPHDCPDQPECLYKQSRRNLFFGWGVNIPLGHLEAGVSEHGGSGGAMPPPMLEEGGQSIICPPPQFRGPRPTRLSIFHS